jgi:predicted dehydrogenase
MIYNPLPNGLHHQWTMKALRSGKHVLCEKPLANNADEAREMVDEAKKQNRLLVEAFHYRYHPFCYETLRNVLSNKNEIGAIQNISADMTIPSAFLQNNDIRFQYPLGGGSQMDAGCYLVSMCRFIVNTYNNRTDDSEGPFEVQKAEALRVSPTNPQIDYGMRSELILDGIKCNLYSAFTNDWSMFKQQIIIECERVTITISFLIAPVLYHYLTIRQRDNGRTQTIKNYGDNQSTYYYQLKAFTEAVKIVQEEGSFDKAYEIAYTTGKSGIRNMEIIDEIYRKSGLVVRGTEI